MPLTRRQLEQRRNAGKASWRAACRRFLSIHTADGVVDYDRAAQALTGFARFLRARKGMAGRNRGITSEYMRQIDRKEIEQ